MLTRKQLDHLEERAPDVQVCTHSVGVVEAGERNAGPAVFFLRMKGHLVLESDDPDMDGTAEVGDHRLFVVEAALSPEGWRQFVDGVKSADEVIARVTDTYRDTASTPFMEGVANFMNFLPEIFSTPKPKDKKEGDES